MRRFKIKSSNNGLKQVGRQGSSGTEREKMLVFEGLAGNDQTVLSFAHNEELAKRGARLIGRGMTISDECLGEQITGDFLRRAVHSWYPKLPQEGIEYGWRCSLRSPGWLC